MINKEDRILLLTELFARAPYGVKLRYMPDKEDDFDKEKDFSIKSIDIYGNIIPNSLSFRLNYCLENTKPYLRPLSSMTDEEKIELCTISYAPDEMKTIDKKLYVVQTNAKNATDFYNKYHFDYRGLIEKGLAIEVTEENNPYKN